MNFGHALDYLKAGRQVARKGWNAPDQFVYLVGEGRYSPTTPTGFGIAANQDDGLVPYRPYLALYTAQGDVATWAPSSSDALAEDWLVVDIGGA